MKLRREFCGSFDKEIEIVRRNIEEGGQDGKEKKKTVEKSLGRE